MNHFSWGMQMIPLRALVVVAWLCAAGSLLLATSSAAQSMGPRILIGHSVAIPPSYSGPDVVPPPAHGVYSTPPPPEEDEEAPPPHFSGPLPPPFPAPALQGLEPPPPPPYYGDFSPPPYGYYSPPPSGYYGPPPSGYYSPPPSGYYGPPPSGYYSPPPYGYDSPPSYGPSSPPPYYGYYSSPPPLLPPPYSCICPPPPYYAPPPAGGYNSPPPPAGYSSPPPSYGYYSPPQSSYGYNSPPPPPSYGYYSPPPPPSYGYYSPPPPPSYGYYSPPPPHYGYYSSPPPYHGYHSPPPSTSMPFMPDSSPPPSPTYSNRRALQEGEAGLSKEAATGLSMHLTNRWNVAGPGAKSTLDRGVLKSHGVGRRLMGQDGSEPQEGNPDGVHLAGDEGEMMDPEKDDGSGLWRWQSAADHRSLAEQARWENQPPPPLAPQVQSVAGVLKAPEDPVLQITDYGASVLVPINALAGLDGLTFIDPSWFLGGMIRYGTPSPYGGCLCDAPPPSYSQPPDLDTKDFSPPPPPPPATPDSPPPAPAPKALPPSRPPRPPPLPPRDPCDTCKACLVLMKNVTLSRTTSAFMAVCREYYSSTACNQVAARILAGTSNMAARAGAMCAALGECPSTLTCPLGITVPYANGTEGYLTGQLDLCSAEGVVGGASTALPSTTPGPGNCRTKSECSTGQVCNMPYYPPQVCSCVAGKDVCYSLGNCTFFCDLESTKYQVKRLNSGTAICTPDASGGAGTGCGSDDICVKVDGCQQWACSNTTQSLYTDSCSGKCRPKNLNALSAQLGYDGRSVSVRLNAYAVQLWRVPCANVFDNATVELLAGSGPGAGTAFCSANDYWLTMSLPTTTLITTSGKDKLVFLSSGSVLVAQVDPTAAFTGNITVASCSPCRPPGITITGPAAIKDPCPTEGASSLLQAAGTVPPAFDAASSIEPSGRATWKDVRWSLPANKPSTGNAASWTLLEIAVNRTNGAAAPNDRLVLSLTTEEAANLTAADYALVVSFTSWLGTSASKSIQFTKMDSTSAPAVQVVGSSVQTFRLAKGLKASGGAGVVCAGRSISWLWTSDWFGLPGEGVSSQLLYLPAPLPAAHGQRFELDLFASYVGDNKTGSAAVTMEAVGSNPVARLVGPSGFVPDDVDLVLNATVSSDPDTARSLQELSYSWDCVREDYPAPCFPDSEEGDFRTTPGIWVIPPYLLTLKKTYTVTVTVSKVVSSGSSSLSATASLTFQPRSAAEPFPRGGLTRQCAASECDLSHSTEKNLTVMLVLQSAYSTAYVLWSSPDASSVAALTATTSATDPTLAPGVHLLTIPAADLPFLMSSITITAEMSHNGFSSTTRLTVPLNSAPYCTYDAEDPALCVKVQLLNDIFPSGVVSMRAQGWADDADVSLTFEFGLRTSDGMDMPQQIGVLSSASLVGLYIGTTTVYGCAIDSEGARTCGTAEVTVKPPAAGFDAAGMLANINLTALEEANDQTGLLQAAAQISILMTYINSDTGSPSGSSSKASEAAASAAASQAATLINAILAGSNLADSQQAQLTLASITNTVQSANGMLTDDTKTTILSAAETITNSILGTSTSATITTTVATQLLTLLAAAAPSSTAGVSKTRTPEEVASTAALTALEWLRKVLSITAQLAAGLGRTAVPGGANVVSAADGLAVSAGAFALSGSGSSAFSSLTLRASAPTSTSSTAAAKWASSSSSSSSTGSSSSSGHRRRLLRGDDYSAVDRLRAALAAVLQVQEATAAASVTSASSSSLPLPVHRQLQGTTSATATTGEAAATLSGDAATTASKYSLGLAHIPTASSALPIALGSALPSTVTLRGGLLSATWAVASSEGATGPPTLDGTTSYILLRIPAPGYDSNKVGNCLLYNSTSNTLSGSLAGSEGLAASDKPVEFVSYNATSGRVTCRVKAAGPYVVGQSPKDVNSPPPPSPPAPPPSSLPPGAIVALDTSGTGSPPASKSSSKSSKAAIIAGSVAAVGGIVIIALAVYIYYRRKHNHVAPASMGGNQLAVPSDPVAIALVVNQPPAPPALTEPPRFPGARPFSPGARTTAGAGDAALTSSSSRPAFRNTSSSRRQPELDMEPEVDAMVEEIPMVEMESTVVQPTPSQIRRQAGASSTSMRDAGYSKRGPTQLEVPTEGAEEGEEDMQRRGGPAVEQRPGVEWVMPNTPAGLVDDELTMTERRQSAWDAVAAKDGVPQAGQTQQETMVQRMTSDGQADTTPRPMVVSGARRGA